MIHKTKHHSFLTLAFRESVIKRAIKIALIVGCILALINHGDRIIFRDMQSVDWFKILLTFCVPYCVSTISSVLAIKREIEINES
ncbi:nitrate/nitrite transporter NrtS [Paracoccaceae bacterium]|nr:nitrate/nitrite transporter NrtS [Paracoccaceae bacterium]